METLEYTGVPVIYADEIGSIEIIGNRARVVMIEYRRVGGEILKQPVVEIIRPLESLVQGVGAQLLREALLLASVAATMITSASAH